MNKEPDIKMYQNYRKTSECSISLNNIPIDNPKPEGDFIKSYDLLNTSVNKQEVFDVIARKGLRSITEELECNTVLNKTNDTLTDETNHNLASISLIPNFDELELTSSDEWSLSDSFVTTHANDSNNNDHISIVAELLNIRCMLIEFGEQMFSVQTQLSSIQEQLSAQKTSTKDSEATEENEFNSAKSKSGKCKSKKNWKWF
ncbi:hypothetical protein CHUAL_013768 [Chamberlinius hualienensis]